MKFLTDFNIELKQDGLINVALTHSSYSNEYGGENYERLEFLGDAILEMVSSEYFYLNTFLKEGDMSKKRASYVCESALYEYAKKIGLIPYIKLGNGMDRDNETIIADVFESVLAVIYLEKGFETVKKYILAIMVPFISNNQVFYSDYKSSLQELVQTDKKSLEYVLVNETGPAHDKTFECEVLVDGIVYGRGSGKSKKDAEQKAAADAIKKQARMVSHEVN